jgi:hypothetical protein
MYKMPSKSYIGMDGGAPDLYLLLNWRLIPLATAQRGIMKAYA